MKKQMNQIIFSGQTETEELTLEETKTGNEKGLILYDDNVNTFDFVIESLVKICGHDLLQAEQCTLLVHYKGRCKVKEGPLEKLEPMCHGLLDRGLTAEIN